MRLVTLNVRNPSFDDGENSWPNRREAFFEVLRRLNPDVLCLQETIESQIAEIFQETGFKRSFGEARERDSETAEYCAVMVRSEIPVIEWDMEWLCDTPSVSTIGWDGKCPRVVTCVDFGDWVLFNTHLDHVGVEARKNGIRQIVNKADHLGKPCLVVGDFNTTPDEPYLAAAYEAGFIDMTEGSGPTFHGYGREPAIRIDYILARGPWTCDRAWVELGNYSDHFAVVAEIELSSTGSIR